MRLDLALVKKYSFTRNKAQQLIESGLILFRWKVIWKPAFDIINLEDIDIIVDKRVHWVSRSAEKLDGFLQKLKIQNSEFKIMGTYCLDVGSSTWGFTQVLLEWWAAHVDAVDVGTDQLHPTLRSDPRVSSYEQLDIREFKIQDSIFDGYFQITNHEQRKTRYDIIVCDASFISLMDIIDAILDLVDTHTEIILLFKPQFEVGQKNLRKTGVPKDEKNVLESMQRFENLLSEKWCKILQKEKSSLMGEAGNQEWIYWIQK